MEKTTGEKSGFSVAGEFVAFVAVEIATRREFLPKSLAGAVQPDFDGIETDADDVGNFGVTEAFHLAQYHHDPVILGKASNELLNTPTHLRADHVGLN
jgi:hypothetical protein